MAIKQRSAQQYILYQRVMGTLTGETAMVETFHQTTSAIPFTVGAAQKGR